jgi:hypothetical protein
MDRDRDLDAYSPVFITNEVGSAKMTTADGELWWDNDRFGSWLACKEPLETSKEEYKLSWWDVITNSGVDTAKCAKVQLLTERFFETEIAK